MGGRDQIGTNCRIRILPSYRYTIRFLRFLFYEMSRVHPRNGHDMTFDTILYYIILYGGVVVVVDTYLGMLGMLGMLWRSSIEYSIL